MRIRNVDGIAVSICDRIIVVADVTDGAGSVGSAGGLVGVVSVSGGNWNKNGRCEREWEMMRARARAWARVRKRVSA